MIDLDKLLELEAKATPSTWDVESWRYGQINFEDAELIHVMRNNIKQLCAELRAAREVVAYFREWNGHSDECDRSPCDCGYSKDLEVLKKYDEARHVCTQ